MLSRRRFMELTAATGALPAFPQFARAQPYPSRPVRIVVGAPPGGTFDIVARLIGQWLSDRLGQQFIIENRPGAGTNIGTEVVAHAAADGYTLLLAGSPAAINATLYRNLNFNFISDIAPVASIERIPLVMAVNPALPVDTVTAFISYANANRGKMNMGSGGIGSTGHVAGELFMMMAAVKMAHVPYRGEAPALTDLISGQVQVVFATVGSTIAYVKAGALRALAVTAQTRLDVLPNLPAVAEFLPGYEASAWAGIGAPSNTGAEIIERLNSEINAALRDPGFRKRIAELGGSILAGSAADFGKFIAAETAKWAKVVRSANITAD
jgi:tripartite-type tricarboxylate transporter receptor subunit TctC